MQKERESEYQFNVFIANTMRIMEMELESPRFQDRAPKQFQMGTEKKYRRFKDISPPKKPCGVDCYLLPNPSNLSLQGKSSKSKSQTIWTGSDQSLFRALYSVFNNSCCALAEALMTKTCREVYKFTKQEFSEKLPKKLPLVTIENISYRKKLYHINKVHGVRKELSASIVHNYVPCDHKGPCDVTCQCINSLNFCEKFCKCNVNCLNRFPGCGCKNKCIRNSCLCWRALRECDPDLCVSCGAGKWDLTQATCKNVAIQRRLSKDIYYAPSKIAGWGGFLRNGAKEHDFLTEYCGEMISQDEAEKRGLVYDCLKSSFLFKLNEEYTVDASRKGNNARFINHSNNPNCISKIMMVNGDHRIGIYAKRDIQPDEELTFDYQYEAKGIKEFVPN